MSNNQPRTKIIAGVIRFKTGTTKEEIEAFFEANGRMSDPGIVSLCIREVSKNQNGFQFVYDLDKSRKWKIYGDFFEACLDALYKHFGIKVQSWDIGEADIVLK